MPITNTTITKFNETQTNSNAISSSLEQNGYPFQGIPTSENINFLFNQWYKNFDFLRKNNFYQWDNNVSYNQNSYTVEDGIIYVSQIDANTGNQPSLDGGTNWKTLEELITIQKATTLEAQTGTNDDKFITPLQLFNSLKGSNQSLTTNGYQKFHGGLIVQWGSLPVGTSGTQTFPISYPNQCFGVWLISNSTNSAGYVSTFNTSNFTWSILSSTTIRYITIGY